MSSEILFSRENKVLELNLLQLYAILMNKRYGIKNITIEGGRGIGKSTILAYFMHEAQKQMPRATGVLVGETYVQIKSRTLPATKEGLEKFGYYENVDYVVGRSGAALGFEMPFQAPTGGWNNVIHFRNGFIWVMVSLEDPNAGRGVNGYVVIGDEAALLRYERLYNNVIIVNRAKKEDFVKKSMYGANIFASTVAMTKTGDWFTKMENKAKENPKEYCFIKGNAKINQHNLRDGYFEKMKKEALSKLHYDAEILNIRPRGVTDGFYSQLDPDIHYYYHKQDYKKHEVDDYNNFVPSCSYDTDLVRNVPLQLNLDFGGTINCATVSQYLKIKNEVRYLKEFTALSSMKKKLSHLIKDFIDYYADHQTSCNDVYLYHDRGGNHKQANSLTTLAQDVEIQLRAAGWNPINMTPQSNNPDHTLKYRLMTEIFSETNIELPVVRINSDNCPNLIISMENAPVKLKDEGFEKDKSSERSTVTKPEHATHLSDTLDYNLYWQFAPVLDYSMINSFPVFTL